MNLELDTTSLYAGTSSMVSCFLMFFLCISGASNVHHLYKNSMGDLSWAVRSSDGSVRVGSIIYILRRWQGKKGAPYIKLNSVGALWENLPDRHHQCVTWKGKFFLYISQNLCIWTTPSFLFFTYLIVYFSWRQHSWMQDTDNKTKHPKCAFFFLWWKAEGNKNT